MAEARRRKYKRTSPETWAIIKAAYLEGFTAVALGRRYGLNPGAIHRKACYEGWTEGLPSRRGRRAPPGDIEALPDAPQDDALDRLPDPVEPKAPPPRPTPAIDPGRLGPSALEGAASLLAEGRLAEAAAYLKLADMGSRIEERTPAAAPAVTRVRWPTAEELWPQIRLVAVCMLGHFPGTPHTYSRAVAQWRRDNLGEDASRDDQDKARSGGWYETVFEPDGSVKPPFEG